MTIRRLVLRVWILWPEQEDCVEIVAKEECHNVVRTRTAFAVRKQKYKSRYYFFKEWKLDIFSESSEV